MPAASQPTQVSPERPKVDNGHTPSGAEQPNHRAHPDRTVAPTVGNPARTNPRTHRMVSPRPERSDQPDARVYQTHDPDSNPRAPAWCRSNRPKDHGVAGASRDRQRPPQSLLECAAPGRSSVLDPRCRPKQLRPSVLQTSELRECILAAPAEVFVPTDEFS